jgi:hypothetical protein
VLDTIRRCLLRHALSVVGCAAMLLAAAPGGTPALADAAAHLAQAPGISVSPPLPLEPRAAAPNQPAPSAPGQGSEQRQPEAGAGSDEPAEGPGCPYRKRPLELIV